MLIFLTLAIPGVTRAQEGPQSDCASKIFGCDTCQESVPNSGSYSCTLCQNNLFLTKHFNEKLNVFENICVYDCKAADSRLVSNHAQKECVYLGENCALKGFTSSSVDSSTVPSCQSSLLNNYGFTLSSRARFQEFLRGKISSGLGILPDYDLPALEKLSDSYLLPSELASGSLSAETSQKVDVKCLNKYCAICDDLNPSQCVTCLGRFGRQDRYGICHQPRTCVASPGTNTIFKDGCYRTSADCQSCEICDKGYTLQTLYGRCKNCKDIDPQCSECSG